ncbi:hydroxyacid dehydrogenase [Arthrobacter sp. PAMC 25486]|uniref:hydroxyacid dehydrogenase n=1 Tax=Arthrobacter sp. PAMC 25486 TaxID=1494608 RepID=UPI00056E8E87|nr:hydroxyacid dehydrogenase [Arthrobacter sp. PAMC 25486]
MGPSRLIGAYAIGEQHFDAVFPQNVRDRISARLEMTHERTDPRLQADNSLVEVLITGWGAPYLDEEALKSLPKLRFVMHAAGSPRPIMSQAAWDRGIRVVTAAAANAIPVADFTAGQVQYALKGGWRKVLQSRALQKPTFSTGTRGVTGATVGIASLGLIGREVVRKLKPLEVEVIAYDPYISPDDAAELGVQLVGIEELFSRSDVVSIHTPLLESTRNMYGASLLELMPIGATLINTARGALVPTDELVSTLVKRPDVFAVLDVTNPEPLPSGHPFFVLPNVVVTPHIAGSLGSEVGLMGALVAAEIERLTNGEPLHHELTPDGLLLSA